MIKDVLVIGAGAAGSTAAFHLANMGIKVSIVDKEKKEEANIKPCGGGMAASVQKCFPFDLSPAVDEVINRVEFNYKLSDTVVAELPGSAPFWIVRREKLDKLITDQAVALGAEYICPFCVNNITRESGIWNIMSDKGEILSAKIIIIANGSASILPKSIGIGPKNIHYAHTTSIRLKERGNLKEGTTRFEFGLIPYGFAWAFPIKTGINIGIGTFIGNKELNVDEILQKLLPSFGIKNHDIEQERSLLRVWNGHHLLHGDMVLSVGDAASLCDPFLAEGIRPAILSGVNAAKCINQVIKGDIPNLSLYTNLMKIQWGNSMAWGKRISHVFYRFPKVGYQLGIKRPTAPKRIAQILSGEMGYEDIAKRVIKRLLLSK